MSQEELSERICSVETLSRIENGKYKIKWKTYNQLMKKMERIPYRAYAICAGKNMELLEERKEINDAIDKLDFEAADAFLQKLKTKTNDNICSKQYILRVGAIVDYKNKKIDTEQFLQRIDEAIRLTLPDYEKYLPNNFPYTKQEILGLMNLAAAYGKLEQHEKSITILKQILDSLSEDYMDETERGMLKINLIRNYASELAAMGKNVEAIELLLEGLKLCSKYSYECRMAKILTDISYNIIELNDRNDTGDDETTNMVKNILRLSYYLTAARNDTNINYLIGNYYYRIFNEEIDVLK